MTDISAVDKLIESILHYTVELPRRPATDPVLEGQCILAPHAAVVLFRYVWQGLMVELVSRTPFHYIDRAQIRIMMAIPGANGYMHAMLSQEDGTFPMCQKVVFQAGIGRDQIRAMADRVAGIATGKITPEEIDVDNDFDMRSINYNANNIGTAITV